MCEVSTGAQSSLIHRLVVGGLIFFGSIQWGLTANAQGGNPKTIPDRDPPSNPAHSDYSLDAKTTTLQIQYKATKNANGVFDLENGVPTPTAININWTTSSGVPPAEGILVSFKLTHKGVPFEYTTPKVVPRKKGSYSIPIKDLTDTLITKMSNRLPRDFAPNAAIVLDDPVAVTVTPILPAEKPIADPPPQAPQPDDASLGTPTRTTNDLTITLHVKH